MQEKEIHIDDWKRILVGDVPPAFFIELVIRFLFVYALIMVSMRLMGKRMTSRLSRNELAALSALAAAVGIPLQSQDKGLLPGLVVAAIVIGGQRLISSIATKNNAVETVTQGLYSVLVKDGMLQIKELLKVRMSKERVFAQLRSNSVKHLGEIKRFYFEANGSFTIIKQEPALPGLSIIPGNDKAFMQALHVEEEILLCDNCGAKKSPDKVTCEMCGNTHITNAVREK